MKEKLFNVDVIVTLQRIVWYVVLVYFAGIVALFMLDIEGAFSLARYGIIFILAAIALILVFMAEQFRKAGLRRFWGLSYLLILILAAIVAGDYFL